MEARDCPLNRGQTITKMGDWLLLQEAYNRHRPQRKRFTRNPNKVNNVGYLWELDLADMSSGLSRQ